MELASLTTTPRDPPVKSLPSSIMNLGFANLEVIDPRRRILPQRYNNSTELEVENASWLLWFFMHLNQKANKRITVLDGVTDPSYQRETELLQRHRGKKISYVSTYCYHIV